MELNKIYNMDCLEGMKLISNNSISMICADLPYAKTRLKWDVLIPLDEMWRQYKRIIKEDGVIVLTAIQPFTSMLVMSNLEMFKYSLVWNKKIISNPQFAKKMPLKQHEDILVFSKTTIDKYTYNPIKSDLEREREWKQYSVGEIITNGKGTIQEGNTGKTKGLYPKSILEFSNAKQKGKIHPTQKPVELFEYLINLYSNEGDLVLDNCMGSGTTAIACIKTDRKFIGFELDEKYYKLANERIKQQIR